MNNKQEHFSRHPLVVSVFSFLLSGILLTFLTNYYSTLQEGRAEKQRLLELRQSAAKNLSELVYDRRVRAELLASAILRGATGEELSRRKSEYDQAYATWNKKLQSSLFDVREIVGSAEFTEFERLISRYLIVETFLPLDRCITSAFDQVEFAESAKAIWQDCEGKRLLKKALDCGYAVTNELYLISSNQSDENVATSTIQSRCQ